MFAGSELLRVLISNFADFVMNLVYFLVETREGIKLINVGDSFHFLQMARETKGCSLLQELGTGK